MKNPFLNHNNFKLSNEEEIPEKNYLDKSLPIKERKQLFEKVTEKLINPFSKEDFNPDNFEPLATEDEKQLLTRKRKIPPKELPTFGLKPKEIRVGQMIGAYESKADIYLTFAWRCNTLQKELDELKQKVVKLENKIK